MADNMIGRLRELVNTRADDTALIVVDANGDTPLTYAQLGAYIMRIAAFLRDHEAQSERALLLMDSGADYVAAFFACLHAHTVAVPAYPPETLRAQHLARLQAIAADADARFILTTRALAQRYGDAFASIAPHAKLIEVDTLAAHESDDDFTASHVEASDLAFLQYTSGSTSTPKGVMVTHGAYWANEIAIQERLGVSADDVFVSWLPLYHDMGLIGSMSQPVFSGIPLVLMSPQFFLERPVRWLDAIARHRGTISGGPDFSYRLCADRVSDEQMASLDLSTWRVAFSGSEPVRHATLDAFVERFTSCGFDANALFPCYGLAEATLLVTGVRRGAGVTRALLDANALEKGLTQATQDEGVTLVSCGIVPAGHTIMIVDRASGARVTDGVVGEILVCGPSVTAGYWRRAEASAETFVERDGERWLRTGDLGFLHDGGLYVAGRVKDLLIVRGRNLYPQDLELVIEREVDLVRRGRVAAFAVQIDGAECIGVAAEISRGVRKLVPAEALAASISEAVALTVGEPAAAVVLLEPGALPKTSSGKVQRAACARRWADRSLEAYAWFSNGARIDQDAVAAVPDALTDIEAELARIWNQALESMPARRDDSFFRLGGNSLGAVRVASAVGTRWSIKYDARDVFEAPSLGAAAALIGKRLTQGSALRRTPLVALSPEARRMTRASHAQRALWMTWAHDPQSSAYNMSGILSIDGPLQIDALQRAFATLVAQHDILRARFELDDEGELVQIVDDGSTIPLECSEGSTDIESRIAHAPFDLEHGPLLRGHLIRASENAHRLVLAVHHIIADGWSVNVLLESLARAYRAEMEATPLTDAPSFQFADFAAWEHSSVDEVAIERDIDYWRNRLCADGDASRVARLFERREASATARNGVQRTRVFSLNAKLSSQLRAFGDTQNASLFMTMLAPFGATLQAISGKRDIRIGAPMSTRWHEEAHAVIGYFIGMQVLRLEIAEESTPRALVAAAKDAVLSAQEHRNVPYDRLVAALLPNRVRADDALFQVKLTEQRPFALDAFAPLATRFDVVHGEVAHFDLALDFVDRPTGIECMLAYDDAVCDNALARRIEALLPRMVEALVCAPDSAMPVSESAAEPDVLTLWKRSVMQNPQRVSVQDVNRTLSYAELDAASDAMASRLRDLGCAPEARVAVLAPRSVEMVLGMLACFKAGATWVPLDPQLPVARNAAQIADCGADIVLYAAVCPDEIAARAKTVLPLAFDNEATSFALPGIVHADQAAYLIYTSGSTGKPKGVTVTHASLGNYVRSMLQTIDVGDGAAFAMVSTPAADLGHTALFGALCSAGTLHLVSPEDAFNPDSFAHYMSRHRVDVLKIVPSHLAALLSASDARKVLPARALIVGGEATSAALLGQIAALAPSCRIFNHYGPTETTVGIAMHAMSGDHDMTRALPLGHALSHARLYVLDERMEPVQRGATGELYLGGAGVARGYHAQPGRSAERFVPNPFVPGARVYRSGDRVRVGHDGTLDYLGRADDQVKIRGYRVEPGEVERVLRDVPGVRSAVVLAYETDGIARLGACVAGAVSVEVLTAHALAALPEYMAPSEMVVVEHLPLNANGKIDRGAILARFAEIKQAPSLEADSGHTPRGETERKLAEIWAEVLLVDSSTMRRDRHFFEAGGDSILGLKVVAKARKAGLKIAPKQLFGRHTLAELAAVAPVKTSDEAMRRLPDDVRARTEASYAQQRLWFLWQLSPESSAYHVSGGLRLRGAVNHAALRASFEAIVVRHESLRTRFVADVNGRVEQIIDAQVALDWRAASLDASEFDATARALAAEPFDLQHGPLLRVALFSASAEEHLLVPSMHHIVSDGWSVQVLLDELVAHYRAGVSGTAVERAALPVQYADYAAWQRDWLYAGERERQLAYWKATLGDEHPVLALPTDAPRPAHASYHAGRHRVSLPPALADAVRDRARQSGATPFMVMLAAFHALLYRYTGQQTVRTGVPVANRHRVEVEGLIGFFVNTQVMQSRVDASTDTTTLLAQVREATLGAQAHQDLPFDVLIDALRPERSLSHTPLFQVMFNHQRRDWRVLKDLPSLEIEPYALPAEMAQFELLLDTREESDGTISLELSYARELFEAGTIARMAQHYEAMLKALVEGTALIIEVPLLSAEERAEIEGWSRNDTRFERHEPVIHGFERHAQLTPDDIALTFGDIRLSYAELNAKANGLAYELIERGVGLESKVGVAAERSVELVVALLAIMKAGGAYVPLDPTLPNERLAEMQTDSGMTLVLRDIDVSGEDARNPDVAIQGNNLAYVIFTSGSTGRPKGVGNTHAALSNRLQWMQQAYPLERGETVLQKTPFSFDVSVWEFFWPLMVGARLAVAAPGAHRDPLQLAQTIVQHEVSTIHFVPSMLQAFIESEHALSCAGTLRRSICSGEALPEELQRKVFARLPNVELHNLYGPTEAAIDVTAWHCREEHRPVPIGAPIAATQTWVLDERMQP
ncbi:non-ribosomal peptide synthetase, partial [Caballeronia sp. GAWG1-1]|uniref:non-ribosomal peptide synthetase n=1 Tax=Caballeronia sp. GAWG1-1 TaxID=2921742 RepID=UPI0020285507